MTEWKCPKCGWTYRSPVPVKDVRHACRSSSTERVTLRLVVQHHHHHQGRNQQ